MHNSMLPGWAHELMHVYRDAAHEGCIMIPIRIMMLMGWVHDEHAPHPGIHGIRDGEHVQQLRGMHTTATAAVNGDSEQGASVNSSYMLYDLFTDTT